MAKRVLLGLVVASCCMGTAAFAQQETEEPDLPPGMAGQVDKLSFMRAREDYIALVRGVPHFQDHDPRLAALQVMKAQEATKALIDPTFWTQIGPAPIPVPGSTNSGRTVAIAVHPTNPNIVYVGARSRRSRCAGSTGPRMRRRPARRSPS